MSLFFEFVQFEFTHAIGPPAARYLVQFDGAAETEAPPARRRVVTGETKGVGVADVLVVGVVPARPTLPRIRRKTRDAESAAPPPDVPLALVTFVKGTEPIDSDSEAARRFDIIRGSEEEQQRRVDEGMKVLNAAIRAYRAGARDPYAIEVDRRDMRRVRIGYGSTDEVQVGAWQAAFEPPPPPRGRTKRVERLRPAEAVAIVLSGRGRVLEAEDVILRALVDLDQDRTRAAAQQVRAAMVLFLQELGDEAPTGRNRPTLDSLAEQAEQLAQAASAAPLDATQVEELEGIIDAMDDLVDAWRYQRPE